MVKVTYNKQLTALLVIDPYNDFISEGGKIWDRIRAAAEANDCVPHMLQVLNAARNATVRFAAELGYEVTVVKDATADYSDEEMHAALDVNLPNYTSAIMSTEEIMASISAL